METQRIREIELKFGWRVKFWILEAMPNLLEGKALSFFVNATTPYEFLDNLLRDLFIEFNDNWKMKYGYNYIDDRDVRDVLIIDNKKKLGNSHPKIQKLHTMKCHSDSNKPDLEENVPHNYCRKIQKEELAEIIKYILLSLKMNIKLTFEDVKLKFNLSKVEKSISELLNKILNIDRKRPAGE